MSVAPQQLPVLLTETTQSKRVMAEVSWYLDEVGVEPSHEDTLDKFLLLTVLVADRGGHGAVRGR